jgi:hypothetical protein
METRNCLECSDRLIGRVDKKFCSDSCRTSFHNKNNGIEIQSIRFIDSRLKRNRKILMDCFLEQNVLDSQIELRKILKKGFVFDFHTHIEKMPNGIEYQFCYEFGYSQLGENQIHLIKQQPY